MRGLARWLDWRRLRKPTADTTEPLASAALDEAAGIRFGQLIYDLGSPDERKRQGVALLLSGLDHRAAIRPLIRAYLRHGDPVLLDALRPFGARLTPQAARELRDLGLSSTERARLMDVLGASGDPGAATMARVVAREPDAVAHIAACVALAALAEPEGIRRLDEDLLRLEPEVRVLALEALVSIDEPPARMAVETHVRRYLAGGGAIPRTIEVTMPVLIEPDVDLARMTARSVLDTPRQLTVITGPDVDALAEGQRETFARLLQAHDLFYCPARHHPDERERVLAAARQRAASDPASRVVVIGRLPSPEGRQALPHFLFADDDRPFGARIVVIGPRKPALVLAWWRYATDRAEVPTDLAAVLTSFVLGRIDLTAEERLIFDLAGEGRRDELARAVLAHL